MNVVHLANFRPTASRERIDAIELAETFIRGAAVRVELAARGDADVAGAQLVVEYAWAALQKARDVAVGHVAWEAVVTRAGQHLLAIHERVSELADARASGVLRAKRLR